MPPPIVTVVAALPLFAGVEPALIESVAAASRIQHAAHRETIVDRGDEVTGVIVVLDGLIEVTVLTEEGNVTTIGILGRGAVIGDAALLDRGPYGVGVAAGPSCRYLWIGAAAFMRAMRESNTLTFNVATALARRLRMMFRRDEWNSIRSVARRLANFLIWLDEQRRNLGPSDPALPVTQEQLGSLIGVSRETVNKHLRRWAQAGWIDQAQGALVVIDPQRLASDEIEP